MMASGAVHTANGLVFLARNLWQLISLALVSWLYQCGCEDVLDAKVGDTITDDRRPVQTA